jgi:parvulin-like peptidyl-prolyl isomerase
MKKTKKVTSKPKTSSVENAKVETNRTEPTSETTNQTYPKNMPMLLLAMLAMGLIGGYALTTLYQEQRPAATVNGENITMSALEKDLMAQGGQKVLDNKVTETLIFQEAKNRKINPTDEEINAKIKDIEKDITSKGQNLDNLLKAQGQTRDDLKQQVKIQTIIEKMFDKDINVTEKEAKDYFEQNKASYGTDVTYESKAQEIKDGLKNQKLADKFQAWLADVKAKAKIKTYLKV